MGRSIGFQPFEAGSSPAGSTYTPLAQRQRRQAQNLLSPGSNPGRGTAGIGGGKAKLELGIPCDRTEIRSRLIAASLGLYLRGVVVAQTAFNRPGRGSNPRGGTDDSFRTDNHCPPCCLCPLYRVPDLSFMPPKLTWNSKGLLIPRVWVRGPLAVPETLRKEKVTGSHASDGRHSMSLAPLV